jgi:3-dehydrosphinganine reductase
MSVTTILEAINPFFIVHLQAACKRMVRDRSRGKIVFVSSLLGYMGIIGYSSYTPGKHALRGGFRSPTSVTSMKQKLLLGLAETLRSEFLLYNIDVHIFFPGTIYTPGYEEENKTKPKVTLKIEETDVGLQPDACAMKMLQGACPSLLSRVPASNPSMVYLKRCTERSIPHNR